MEIRIALNNSPGVEPGTSSDEHQCGYVGPIEHNMLGDLSGVMPNRDANVISEGNHGVVFESYGHVESWSIESNPHNGRSELLIKIKLPQTNMFR